jgi:hypothetical protein
MGIGWDGSCCETCVRCCDRTCNCRQAKIKSKQEQSHFDESFFNLRVHTGDSSKSGICDLASQRALCGGDSRGAVNAGGVVRLWALFFLR